MQHSLVLTLQENQAVNGELHHVLEEKSSLDLKLHEYAQSLQRYEETVSIREQEKSELINSYNGLNNQTEKLNVTLQKMEGSLSAAKLELLTVSQVSSKLSWAHVIRLFGCACRKSIEWRVWLNIRHPRYMPSGNMSSNCPT